MLNWLCCLMGSKRTIKRDVDTKAARLNRQTPTVDRCAWPGCDPTSLKPIKQFGTGRIVQFRIGILCYYHADLVADAVLQNRLMLADYEHHEANSSYDISGEVRRRDKSYRNEVKQQAADTFRGEKPGFVYYLRVGERVKIGYSVDVKRRMRSYPPGSQLLAVEPGDRDLETQRHRQFAGSLLDGREWFRPTPDIDELVTEIVATYGEPKQFAHHYRSKREPMRVRVA